MSKTAPCTTWGFRPRQGRPKQGSGGTPPPWSECGGVYRDWEWGSWRQGRRSIVTGNERINKTEKVRVRVAGCRQRAPRTPAAPKSCLRLPVAMKTKVTRGRGVQLCGHLRLVPPRSTNRSCSRCVVTTEEALMATHARCARDGADHQPVRRFTWPADGRQATTLRQSPP